MAAPASAVQQYGFNTPVAIDPTQGNITSLSCTSPTACVAVDSGGHAVVLAGSGAGSTWSTPKTVDPSGNGFTSVSCVSGPFCMAVDNRGDATVYQSGTWSAPAPADHSGMSAVSCVSTTFCLAVDSGGEFTAYNGSGWSTPASADSNGLISVSCVATVTTPFCAAVDYAGYTVVYQGGVWGTPAASDLAGNGFSSVSCFSSSFCAAADNKGDLLTYNGTAWSSPTAVDPQGITAVSCNAASFCVAVDFSGSILVYNGSSQPSGQSFDMNGFSTVSCPASAPSFCMAADTNGNVVSFDPSTLPSSTRVTSPSTTNFLSDVSCPSASFCGAVDNAGDAYTFNGSAWSAPDSLSTGFNSVSCLSSSFCVAVAGNGNIFTYDGTRWTAALGNPVSSIGFSSVSCTGTAASPFCVATDDAGYAYTYTGTSWTGSTNPVDQNGQPFVSCEGGSTSPFCAIVDAAGFAFTYSSGTWSSGTAVDTGGGFNPMTVSCVSGPFCAAVDSDGTAYTYSSSSWHPAPGNPITTFGLYDVSCVSSSACYAITGDGRTTGYNGTSWSSPATISNYGLMALSCASTSNCVATDGSGNAVTYDPASLPTTTLAIPPFGDLTSVSCVSSSFCAALDLYDHVQIFDGTTWTTPAPLESAPSSTGSSGLGAVSCASSTFCMAVDGSGNAFQYDGSTWTAYASNPIEPSGAFGVDSISCASRTFCMAVDYSGTAVEYNGSTWSGTAGTPDSSGGLTSVSCVSASFCVAVDSNGNEFTYTGSWSAPTSIDSTGSGMTSVSCASTMFCVATDNKGDEVTYTGSGWSAPHLVSSNPLTSVSCTAGPYCVAVDYGYAFTTSDGSTWTSAPGTPIDATYGGLTSISCTSATFCAAVDGQGNATWEIPISAPGAPQNLIASPNNTSGYVQLSWQPPSSDGGSAITDYDIYRSTTSGTETYLGDTGCGTCTTYYDSTAPGTYYYTVAAVNQAGTGAQSAEAVATLASSGPTITTTTLPEGVQDKSYTTTLQASGGTGPYTWSVSSGALPAGLTLDVTTGTISGTPTSAGTSDFTAEVTDSVGHSGTSALSINVAAPLKVTTTSLPSAVVNQTYSATLQASGGTGSDTWSITSGSLPTGLTLNSSTGAITGTATATGTSAFTVKVTDSSADTASANLSITVVPPGYTPITPTRLFDTRFGTGGVTKAPIGPNAFIAVKVAGVGNVPTSATAVALNITATDGTAGTYIAAWPDGSANPGSSNLNPSAGETLANFDIVSIGPDGYVDFYNAAGSTDVLADVAGYFVAGTGPGYTPITPTRLFDTRFGTDNVSQAPIGPNTYIQVKVAGVGNVPTNATAVALNITATDGTAGTYIAAWPDGQTDPGSSNLNPSAGETLANFDIVSIGPDGYIDVYNAAGSTDVLADVAGYFVASTGPGYTPITPTRLFDTRFGLDNVPQAPIGPNTFIAVKVAGVGNVPTNATAVALNITATDGTAGTYIAAWPDGSANPGSSNLNPSAGETLANFDIVSIGPDGYIDVYNAAGSTDVLADVAGYFTSS